MKVGRPFQLRGKWYIRWTDENGKRRKRAYERHADAARALAVETGRVGEVRAGARLPTPPSKRYGDIADYWIKYRVPRKRSGYHDKRVIEAHLRPFFGAKLLTNIGTEDALRYQREKAHLSPKTLHNHLTLLIAQLREALELRWLLRVPKLKKPTITVIDEDYSYLRSDEEIGRFLRAAFADGELTGTLYSVALYTGMRAGELAGLRWDRVDLEHRLIKVDHSYGGPTKSRRARHVPILDPILSLLREWRLKTPGVHVFPNQLGSMLLPSSRIFQEALHRVLDAAGFPKTEKASGGFKYYVRFHDLRHSFASLWMQRGGDLFRLQRILGHASTAMTMRYSHLAPSAFAADHDRLGLELPMTKEASVVPLHGAQPQ